VISSVIIPPLVFPYKAAVMHFVGGWYCSHSPTMVAFKLRFEGSGEGGGQRVVSAGTVK